MNKRQYNPALLEALNERKRIDNEDGLIIIEKPVPESDEEGILDPRIVKGMEEAAREMNGHTEKDSALDRAGKSFRTFGRHLKGVGRFIGGDMTGLTAPIGAMFDVVRSIPLGMPVRVFDQHVHNEDYGDHQVTLRLYKPEERDEDLPVLIYIHGGGFIGGNLEGVDEMCRFMAAKGGCLVVSVDYRLAPEHKFPSALSDCRAAVNWVWHNARRFGGDVNRITVAGDSVGGNLAAACVLLDERRVREGKRRRIGAQILLYPTLNLSGIPDLKYRFNRNKFNVKPEYQQTVNQMVYSMRLLVNCIPLVIGKFSLNDPLVNPYFADPLPEIPTLLCIGEFDCLRPETEAYGKKLMKNGSPVRIIRYAGVGHGYADQVGELPQAEDTLVEMSRFITDCFPQRIY